MRSPPHITRYKRRLYIYHAVTYSITHVLYLSQVIYHPIVLFVSRIFLPQQLM